jgi:hypothetical protein
MSRGPARKSRDQTMPELFRASSNQLPSVRICPTNAPRLSAFSLRSRRRRARISFGTGRPPWGRPSSHAGHAHPQAVQHAPK